ncbi:cytochrome c biogenesis protein [Synechococcus elongatus IITB4]|uniref:cytochrome c biogenesis protein n=1 Tax=Synechococcus elongatus TaxID=32046 RepID=UPI0030CAF36C
MTSDPLVSPSLSDRLRRGQQIFWTWLADLRLAIALLLGIAIASASGTVIEQGQSLAFYQENYPTDPALFGFLSWRWILTLGLDHVYRAGWFLGLLILFGASLTACTFRRQWPALQAAQRWQFYQEPRQFSKLALSASLPQGKLETLEPLLRQRRYRLFRADDALYARRGLAGRVGPILVHAGMLVVLGGAIWGSLGGFFAQEMVPSGETFQVRNVIDAGPWSSSRIPQDWSVKVNRFWIDYAPDGRIDQFYSDLSVVDQEGQEQDRQTIHVNQPLRYGGLTFYQADWAIAAAQVRLNNSPVLQLPMARLPATGRIWGTFVPTKPDLSSGVSLIAKDLQGTAVVYGNDGEPLATLRKGMAVEVDGVRLSLVDLVGSTGLQIKSDPGIPWVYAGFLFVMVGVVCSYISHAQVWALQQDGQLYIGGRSNRALVAFEQEMLEVLAQLDAQSQHSTESAIA